MPPSKRVHASSAAGAGNLGAIHDTASLGPCPSCGADLRIGTIKDPRTQRQAKGLLHPMPFCTYFGETDPGEIAEHIKRAERGRLS